MIARSAKLDSLPRVLLHGRRVVFHDEMTATVGTVRMSLERLASCTGRAFRTDGVRDLEARAVRSATGILATLTTRAVEAVEQRWRDLDEKGGKAREAADRERTYGVHVGTGLSSAIDLRELWERELRTPLNLDMLDLAADATSVVLSRPGHRAVLERDEWGRLR